MEQQSREVTIHSHQRPTGENITVFFGHDLPSHLALDSPVLIVGASHETRRGDVEEGSRCG
eukprot:scaffold3400_cov198-Alexandrium_tamarense.AAC.9